MIIQAALFKWLLKFNISLFQLTEIKTLEIDYDDPNFSLDFKDNFGLLIVRNCASINEAFELAMYEEFSLAFMKSPTAIGILIEFNDETTFLGENEIQYLSQNYCNIDRPVLITFQSSVDKFCCLYWRTSQKHQFTSMEISENISEEQNLVNEFLRNFLLKSLRSGYSGES